VELLTGLLQDTSPEIRRTAAESLGKIGDQAAAASLLPLLTDSVPLVRAAAAQALGRLGSPSDEELVGALTGALEDPVGSVRQAAALAIGEIEPASKLLEPVLGLLKSSRAQTRRSAVLALLQVDAGPWAPALISALDDPDIEVRQGAVAALGAAGGPYASTGIRDRLAQDSSPGVRVEAAYQLGKLGGSEVPAALERAVEKDSEPAVRRWAEGELRSIRGTD
jgi:HEAT repeat protein